MAMKAFPGGGHVFVFLLTGFGMSLSRDVACRTDRKPPAVAYGRSLK